MAAVHSVPERVVATAACREVSWPCWSQPWWGHCCAAAPSKQVSVVDKIHKAPGRLAVAPVVVVSPSVAGGRRPCWRISASRACKCTATHCRPPANRGINRYRGWWPSWQRSGLGHWCIRGCRGRSCFGTGLSTASGAARTSCSFRWHAGKWHKA